MQPRHLAVPPAARLARPVLRLQPILARPGTPSVDPALLASHVSGIAERLPIIAVRDADRWGRVVRGLGPEIDAILPLPIPCYPTEVWNSHPQPLVDRRLPFLFWCLPACDEPDFWRWSTRDFLSTLGVEVLLVESRRHGLDLLRGLALRRMLAGARLAVFGAQNFPWNAHGVKTWIASCEALERIPAIGFGVNLQVF